MIETLLWPTRLRYKDIITFKGTRYKVISQEHNKCNAGGLDGVYRTLVRELDKEQENEKNN